VKSQYACALILKPGKEAAQLQVARDGVNHPHSERAHTLTVRHFQHHALVAVLLGKIVLEGVHAAAGPCKKPEVNLK
jgi:hypothetical protein